MTGPTGSWEPLRTPERTSRTGRRTTPQPPTSGLGNGLRVTSFTRLARVQVLSSMGDGLIAVALAGSIFFSIDPSDARWRVALYLILTIAPFAIVTPLLGPAIDRAKGGRRGTVIGSLAGRAVIAFLMARHIDSLLLFPEAFAMLVLQKGYFVSRAALVPAVCPSEDELIEANSKLSLISSFSGIFGGAIGATLVFLFSSGSWPTGFAVLVFFGGAAAATQIPQVQVASEPADITEKLEVRGANILLAASTVGVMRGIVGFTTFLLAFHLRAGEDGIDRSEPGAGVGAAVGFVRDGFDVDGTPGPPTWHFGAAGLAVGIGAFLGARYAPRMRESIPEERIVVGALATVSVLAYLGAWGGGVSGIIFLSFGVGLAAALAKLGFDAIVQRDAPLANHGRTFAKFEGRFQMMWALGAFVPVVIPMPMRLGTLLIAFAGTFAAVSYELGRRTDRVKRSSRVREAIRQRMPEGAVVERLGLNPALGKVRPMLDRFGATANPQSDRGPSPIWPDAEPVDSGADPAPMDPTEVAPLPSQQARTPDAADPAPSAGGAAAPNPANPTPAGAVPIDAITWISESEPHLSSGHGVWLASDEPTEDAKPPTAPDDDGQFRLWRDESHDRD